MLFCCNGIPPKIDFSITINRDFSLSCYRSATYVPTRELVGEFSGKLEKFSQLSQVIDRVKTFVDITTELKSCKKDLNDLIRDSQMEAKQKKQLEFFCEQEGEGILQKLFKKQLNCTLKAEIVRHLRDTLISPYEDTIKSYFGKIGTPGNPSYLLYFILQ